ncbi:hypothetical protein D3C76_1142950 [compost metagenome]
MFAFGHQGRRLLRFQLFFARQHFIQQGADCLFRLRPLEAINRLTVLEQINRWDGAQAKLRGDHLLGVAVQFCQNELTVVLGRKLLEHRRQLQTVLTPFRPKVEQHRFGHRLFKGLVQVCFGNVDNILYGHAAFSVMSFYLHGGVARGFNSAL